jgi:gliding motility-associated-like protein
VICAGRSYTLPWGVSVSATGVYRDTLRYAATGCDSLYRIVELTVQSPTDLTTPVTICSGGSYRLPWDVTVRTAGTYRDTLRYVLTGCDSLRRTVVITVTPPAVAQVIRTAICANEAYTLPWGVQVNRAGTYRDTLKTATGCDSLVRTVELTVHPQPTVWATKANDINCIVSTAALQATGALRYRWRPGGSLSDTAVANPVASPTVPTLYVVEGTDANGCRNRDSVRVLVNFADDPLKYPVPSAFTPNGDGINDCFGVRHWGEVEGFSMQVYNRYGGVIYASTKSKSCWDGTYLGIKQVSGIYLYVIRGKGPCGEVMKKGTVTLIR